MQTHNKFKVFIASGSDVIQRAEAVLNAYHVAPKSLGVEYLEEKDLVILTLGYRDDEPAREFKIREVALGKLALEDRPISAAMEAAAAGIDNIICHEFYVNKTGEFFAVFLIVA